MSLTQKILAFVSALVLVLLIVTLAYTTYQANRLAQENLRAGLAQTTEGWETFQKNRYVELRLGLRTLASDAGFKALVEARDPRTTADTLVERGADFGADLLLVTDAQGIVLARAGSAATEGTNLSSDPVVARVFEGAESATIWRQGTRLFHTVSVPMATTGQLQGILIAGFALDERLAANLRKLTRSEIAFFTKDAEGWAVSATTLANPGPTLGAAGVARTDDPVRLKIGGGDYVAVSVPLVAATGEIVGSVAALRSVDQEMAPFRRFRNSLIGASLLVLAGGLVTAFVATKAVTRPVRSLANLVDKVRDGSYSGAVSVPSRDEIGSLAKAFNGLLADLREKEQMVAFLKQTMAPGAPDPGHTVTTPPGRATAVGPRPGDVPILGPGVFASRYEILGTLGRGGMGVVYKARDLRLDEVVALKTLRPDVLYADPGLLERFKQELKLARSITHKNVLRTYDFGEDGGTPYISMEYVEGVTLKQLIANRGALPVSVGLRVAKEMCHGLEAAHERGVIHRDIKSQNMMVIPATGELKIMDFGLARQTSVPLEGGLTMAGAVMGTPDYIPPEQAEGQPADVRSDIYSLGVVLFETFTGRLPFVGDRSTGTIAQHIAVKPPSLRTLNAQIPVTLDAIVLRCLEKAPRDRYAGVAWVRDALDMVSASGSA